MQYARAATAEWHGPLFIKKRTHKHDASYNRDGRILMAVMLVH